MNVVFVSNENKILEREVDDRVRVEQESSDATGRFCSYKVPEENSRRPRVAPWERGKTKEQARL